ncbi:hypothetical protein OG426_37500 [Streptomyces canus]|uniref:hypothetical protein n=1 Tax=Streptomyces canus TaxID=58343 RepID=UPI00225321DA|nr:hypothetical protein [Streptomyces canus]MCX4856875.1 hypothetical protein [Streptomyces canus]WSW37741.1 hypothetical protein OG426_37500 [Streptomyces canus]
MQERETLFDQLRQARAWDIQIPGYIDRDGSRPRFVPFPESVYVALEGGYLQLKSVGDEGRMTMHMVAEPVVPAALVDDEDEFAVGSNGLTYLADAHSEFRITRIRGVRNPDGGTAAQYHCLEFQFEKSWYLFVDPGYHFGIRLQGEGAYERWLSMYGVRPPDAGEGFVWTP